MGRLQAGRDAAQAHGREPLARPRLGAVRRPRGRPAPHLSVVPGEPRLSMAAPTDMSKTALITGITGQDGAYLAELLLAQGYTVHGIKRRASLFNTDRVDHLYQDPHVPGGRFFMHYGDLTDATNLIRIVQETQPDEIYNLAAQSHVQVSFETPEYTANSDALGTLRLLEAMRILGLGDSGALLPGLHQRDVRPRAGGPAARDHALLPAQPLRRRQGLRLLDHGELPRGLRHARQQRHPLQPREPHPRRDLRDAQDHARRGAHRPGPRGRASTSATSTRCATGATPATTCAPCT